MTQETFDKTLQKPPRITVAQISYAESAEVNGFGYAYVPIALVEAFIEEHGGEA